MESIAPRGALERIAPSKVSDEKFVKVAPRGYQVAVENDFVTIPSYSNLIRARDVFRSKGWESRNDYYAQIGLKNYDIKGINYCLTPHEIKHERFSVQSENCWLSKLHIKGICQPPGNPLIDIQLPTEYVSLSQSHSYSH